MKEKIQKLKDKLLAVSKYSNSLRVRRNLMKTQASRAAVQAKIDQTDRERAELRAEIEKLKNKNANTNKSLKGMATSKTKKVSRKEAMTSCGTHLKPGYKFVKGGGVVKIIATAKKPTTRKKSGLGKADVRQMCIRTNPDGSITQYTQHGGSNPCPYGGKVGTPYGYDTPALGRPAKKKPASKKPAAKRKRLPRKK